MGNRVPLRRRPPRRLRLLAANQHNQAENQEGVKTTAAIGRILLAAGQDVENLNTIIRNKYSRQPGKLHTWQTASRIHRAPVRKKKPAPPPPPPLRAPEPRRQRSTAGALMASPPPVVKSTHFCTITSEFPQPLKDHLPVLTRHLV